MSIQYLEQLREKEIDVIDFRTRLAEYPPMLERAETAYRLFEKSRTKLVESIAVTHEARGLRGGIALMKPFVGIKKEMLRGLVTAKKVTVPHAKEFMQVLIGFDEDIDGAIRKQRDEQMAKEGSAQAHHFAAMNAIEDIAMTLARVETRASSDDLDDAEEAGGPGHNRRTLQAAANVKKAGKKAGKTSRKKRPKNGVSAPEA